MPRPPAVSLRGVRLRHGAHVALDSTDLDLPAGQRSVVIGPNGSGKSTLLRAISGLHAPSGGTVRVLDGTPRARRARIAHVLQATQINEAVPITAREVVGMGRFARHGLLGRDRGDHAKVDAALDRLDVAHLAHRHLATLSVGQRQRVLMAQAVVQEADLLLLDEPQAGLDLTSGDRIERLITDEVDRGVTVVVTTHDLHTAMQADHVVLLANRVVASGAPAAVLSHDHLTVAYGGHLHELPGGGLVLDDPAPH